MTGIEIRENLDADEFRRVYANSRPVLIRAAIGKLPAVSRWSPDYLKSAAPDLAIRVKTGDVSRGATEAMTLGEYCSLVSDLGSTSTAGQEGAAPPYLHDFPLLRLVPDLRKDLDPFPLEFFPKFYHAEWWSFAQFFVSPPRGATPLHFDTLQTHNLFFQIHGTKRFIMIPAEDRRFCYTYNWRWSPVNAEQPDLERYPLFKHARVIECDIQAGDLLYMPPGTLHQVRSTSTSISFNLDWHDRRSAIEGVLAVTRGMPLKNLGYNLVFSLGLFTGLPAATLMPLLRSYFYYIS